MITEKRLVYKPFEYPKAEEYFMKQNHAHWLHTEVSMSSDIADWKSDTLTESERNLVGMILKSFAQTEVVVGDYWGNISSWFPKPEIQSMAASFSAMEAIHARAYAYLNDSLGLDNYTAFLEEPTAKEKIDAILDVETDDIKQKAIALAVFSGGVEGISLFSSFAILLNFMRFNKLKGVGEIVTFSIRDESLHSEAGCWLFRELMEERPELWTDDLKKQVYEAIRQCVKLEDAFIDKAFEMGDVEGLAKEDLKAFIRYRANTKLQDLNLKKNWKNLDTDAANRVADWFEALTIGVQSQDFFAGRVTEYAKASVDYDSMW